MGIELRNMLGVILDGKVSVGFMNYEDIDWLKPEELREILIEQAECIKDLERKIEDWYRCAILQARLERSLRTENRRLRRELGHGVAFVKAADSEIKNLEREMSKLQKRKRGRPKEFIPKLLGIVYRDGLIRELDEFKAAGKYRNQEDAADAWAKQNFHEHEREIKREWALNIWRHRRKHTIVR